MIRSQLIPVMRHPSARHTAIKARTKPIPASAAGGEAAFLCQKPETDPAEQVLRLRDKPFHQSVASGGLCVSRDYIYTGDCYGKAIGRCDQDSHAGFGSVSPVANRFGEHSRVHGSIYVIVPSAMSVISSRI